MKGPLSAVSPLVWVGARFSPCTADAAVIAPYLPRTQKQFLCFVTNPRQVDSSALLRDAEGHHGVRFTPGAACGGGGQHCVRLSYSFYTEDELRESARRLGRAVREHLLMRKGSPAGRGEAGEGPAGVSSV